MKLVPHFEHKYDYITNEGRAFYFRTNRDGAAKYKVVKVTLPPAGDAAEEDAAALAKLPFEVRYGAYMYTIINIGPGPPGPINGSLARSPPFVCLTD